MRLHDGVLNRQDAKYAKLGGGAVTGDRGQGRGSRQWQ